MRDFTIDVYSRLLEASVDAEYKFLTFEKFLTERTLPTKTIVMRHDVDRKSHNALVTAQIEKEQGILASYYFRVKAESYNKAIIKKIVGMGHEIGYHYEDLALAKGDFNQAIKRFKGNLKKLRELYPVKTICMHGSPLSKWDNRKIWEKYDYKNFGIIGEPYYDIDFNRVLYLTDTGRRWNGEAMNLRDIVDSLFNFDLKSTTDIIDALKANKLPNKIMMNTHPQRWESRSLDWFNELLWQNLKNLIKKLMVKKND